MPFVDDTQPDWFGAFDDWPSMFMTDYVAPIEASSLLESKPAETTYSTVYLYLSVEDGDDEEDLTFFLLSAMPSEATWLSRQLDMGAANLWATAFDIDMHSLTTETPVADWALRAGLCPGQWFVVKLEPVYIKHPGTDYGVEWDFGCKATITDREELDSDWQLSQWLSFFESDRGDGLPRLSGFLIS